MLYEYVIIVLLQTSCCTNNVRASVATPDVEHFEKLCKYYSDCSKSPDEVTAGWLHPNCTPCDVSCGHQAGRPVSDCPVAADQYPSAAVCRHAQTRTPGSVISYSKSYLMVDHCPSSTGDAAMCNTLSSRFQGIHPVSSESGGTYVNEECAHCNKEHRTVPWDIVMTCLPKNRLSYTPEVLSSLEGGPCDIIFLPPEPSKTKPIECLQSIRIVDPCNYTDDWNKFMSDIRGYYHDIPVPIVDITTFGLRGNVVNGNFYCASCSGNQSLNNGSRLNNCSIERPKGPEYKRMYAFVLNPSLLEMERAPTEQPPSEAFTGTPCGRFALQVPAQPECRRVYCPEGSTRDRNGRCQSYIKAWLLGKIFFVLDLWIPTGQAIPVAVFEGLADKEKANLHSWLEFPSHGSEWQWSVRYGVRTGQGRNTQTDVVVLKLYATVESGRIEPDTMYNVLLSNRWSLLLGGRVIELSAKPASLPRREDDHTFHELLPGQNKHFVSSFYLHKLFFCNQVELFPHEYEQKGRGVLYLPFVQKSLSPDDYLFVEEDDTAGKAPSSDHGKVRVCVDDVAGMPDDTTTRTVKTGLSTVSTKPKGSAARPSEEEEEDFVKSTSFGMILLAGLLATVVLIRIACKRHSGRQSPPSDSGIEMDLGIVQTQGQVNPTGTPSANTDTVAETEF